MPSPPEMSWATEVAEKTLAPHVRPPSVETTNWAAPSMPPAWVTRITTFFVPAPVYVPDDVTVPSKALLVEAVAASTTVF